MAKTFVHKVVFKNTTPKVLYNLYMDAKKHSMISGHPAKIAAKVKGAFSVYGGYISGITHHLEKDKQIVQSWRTTAWDKLDADSTFIINLAKKGKDVVMTAIHTNVPDLHAESISKGWNEHYWKPWKQFIAGKKITRPKMDH